MIDATVLVGPAIRARDPAAYSLAAARAELIAHGFTSALVASRSGAAYRAEVGNDEVFAAAADPGPLALHPVATLHPVEYLGWRTEADRALAGGAVAMRFYPDEQGWDVESEAFRTIAGALRGRCPLLLPVARFGDASRVGRATADLDVPVVLVGAHYTQLADCLAALDRWPQLHLEMSRLAQYRGVETVVRAVGAERLLFGSGAPVRPIQAGLNAVLTADVSDADKRAILAGNAGRVFGIPVEPFDLPLPTRGQALIDVHGHIGSLAFPTPPVDPAALVATARRHGIAHTVASSARAIADRVEPGNREALAAAAEMPAAQLLAYVVVNPNDPDAACQSMDRAYAAGAAVGAKLHSQWSGHPTASDASLAVLEQVARRERPLLLHIDGPGWADAVHRVAEAYPRWNVILAHAGPGTPIREAADLVERTDNVYVELATSFPDLPVIRDVVRRVGPDRLLFGTDSPLIDPAYVLGVYTDAGADLSRTTTVAREVFGL